MSTTTTNDQQNDIKEAYFSKRIHIGESTTQKTLGMKTRSIEITWGNQEVKKIIKSKDDLADIENKSIVTELIELWDELTVKGQEKGWRFTEDYLE